MREGWKNVCRSKLCFPSLCSPSRLKYKSFIPILRFALPVFLLYVWCQYFFLGLQRKWQLFLIVRRGRQKLCWHDVIRHFSNRFLFSNFFTYHTKIHSRFHKFIFLDWNLWGQWDVKPKADSFAEEVFTEWNHNNNTNLNRKSDCGGQSKACSHRDGL